MSPKDLVRVFSVKDGVRVATYGEPLYPADGVRWSPDGRFLAFITGHRTLHLWNPFRPEPTERAIRLGGSFSPDGGRLAVGIDQNVRIFRIAE
jgi:WD40 repeat protein